MRRHGLAGLLLTWLVVQPYYPDMSQPLRVRLWRAVSFSNTWIAVDAFDTKRECVAAATLLRRHAQSRLNQESQDVQAILQSGAEAQARCVPADAVPILPFTVTASEYLDLR